MADHTAIEWAGATWSPVVGCTKVDAACGHCYIPRTPRLRILGMRFERKGNESTTGLRFFEHMLAPDYVRKLRPRDRPVFVCSLSDLFHPDVPDEFIARVWGVMDALPERTFQVLTKRPERARDWLRAWYGIDGSVEVELVEPPNENVWVGTSIGTARYTYRADVLREIPAAVRFLSCEPLLGSLYPSGRDPAEVRPSDSRAESQAALNGPGGSPTSRPERVSPTAQASEQNETGNVSPPGIRAPLDLTGIDWVIVGGESGGRFARPMHPDWAREIRDAVLAIGRRGIAYDRPAFFFKQWGCWAPRGFTSGKLDTSKRPESEVLGDPGASREGGRVPWRMFYYGASPKSGGRLLDGREWNEMPIPAEKEDG